MAAADTGRVLHKASITAHEAFSYKVRAEDAPGHNPLGSPYPRSLPYEGEPDPGASEPAVAPPIDVTMEGFNRHGQSPDRAVQAEAETDDDLDSRLPPPPRPS